MIPANVIPISLGYTYYCMYCHVACSVINLVCVIIISIFIVVYEVTLCHQPQPYSHHFLRLDICGSRSFLPCSLIYYLDFWLMVFLILFASDPSLRRSKLKPPVSLSANQGSAGVVLQWSLAEAQHPPITGFVLQSRTEQGEWSNLDEDISANATEIIVPGLHKVTSQLHCSIWD